MDQRSTPMGSRWVQVAIMVLASSIEQGESSATTTGAAASTTNEHVQRGWLLLSRTLC